MKDEKSVLFEVKVDVGADLAHPLEYQWYKNKEEFRSEVDQECLPCVDLTFEGSYTCKITCGEKEIVRETIVLTVVAPLDQHQSVLIDRYTEQPHIPEDTWPPVSQSIFINLALIRQEGAKQLSSYSRYTIQGDADDILKDKESISYEKVFSNLESNSLKVVQVVGRPL